MLHVSSTKGWDSLTCLDFHGSKIGPRKRPIVTRWNQEHESEWYQSSWRKEKTCDRDEYPPVYFFSDDDPVMTNYQQLIRLLPYRDNRGAGAGLWGPFCWTEGLKDPKAKILNMPDSFDSSTVGKDGTSKLYDLTATDITDHICSL